MNEENSKPFGNWRKVIRLWINTLQFQLKKEGKQTNKQSNLLNVSYEKKSCLIRGKNKKNKKIKVNE